MLRPVRAPVRRGIAASLLACALLAGCGGSEPSPEQQVRRTLTEFGRATSAKDYQALCDRIFAPQLVEELKQVGLPCEVAMQQSLRDVRDPSITVGAVTVTDRTATAEVRSSAKGQRPSQDTVELVELDGAWRISSLG
jgi:hypothetical protein